MAKLPNNTAPKETSTSRPKRVYPGIPEDTCLNVVVDKCEIKEKPEFLRFNEDDTHQVSFKFKVIDEGEYHNRVIWDQVPPYFNDSDKCKLRLWTQAITGNDKMPDGYVFDTEDLVGLNCRIVLKAFMKKDGTVGNGVKEILRAESTTASVTEDDSTTEWEPF